MKISILKMNSCPVCDSKNIELFLERNRVPVHQNLLFDNQKSAINIQRSDLKMTFCKECGFIFNQTFDLTKLDYSEKYENTQDYSPVFDNYLNNLAKALIFDENVKNCKIVEVGCGKGTFLKKLVENEEWGNIGYGFDPSYVGPEKSLNDRLIFRKSFYDSAAADIEADVVLSRHVIEHVQNPIKLLKMIKQALANSPNAKVFFETPTVEWILKNKVIWDFFYEHCSLFTINSLSTAFEVSGYKVEKANHVFGEQYILLEATSTNESVQINKNPNEISKLSREFSKHEKEITKNWYKKISEFSQNEKIAIWGAGAKGVTFANLIDPERKLIDCIIDLNPKKQGKYIPGTGHPIINYNEISSRKLTSVIVMNPNYLKEITRLLNNENLSLNLIQ